MLTDPDKLNGHQLNIAIISEKYIQMFAHFLILQCLGCMRIISCDIYNVILFGFFFNGKISFHFKRGRL